jgi:uncharacterized membrane protein
MSLNVGDRIIFTEDRFNAEGYEARNAVHWPSSILGRCAVMKFRITFILVAIAFVSSCGLVGAASLYTLTPIDFGVGRLTDARAINDNGEVAGTTTGFESDGITRRNDVFRWTQSGGYELVGQFRSGGSQDINSNGTIVGQFSPRNGDPDLVRYSDSEGFTSIGDLGGGFTRGFAINDAGVIAGESALTGATEANRAFRWTEAGGMVVLNGLPGSNGSRALGINNAGDVVGRSSTGVGLLNRAVIWPTTGGVIAFGPNNLMNAVDINNMGAIIGEAADQFNAYYFFNGQTTLIGNLSGLIDGSTTLRALNDSGMAVGSSTQLDFFQLRDHGIIWDETDGLQDLNELIPENSGWFLGEAFDINNAGQIVGGGVFNGRSMGYLLTPVPEPTVGLLGILSLCLLLRRKRNQ